MIKVSGKVLAATVRNVTVLTTSNDNLSSTVRVELDGKTLTLISTDRYRLIVARVPVVNVNDESWAFNVDGASLSDICKGLAKVFEVTVTANPGNDSPMTIEYSSGTYYVAKGAVEGDRYPDTVHIERKFEGVLIPLTTYQLNADMLKVLGKLKFDGKGVTLNTRTVRTGQNSQGTIDMGMIEYATVDNTVDYRIVTMTRTPR